MRREADLVTVQHQVSLLADQVVSLVDVISSQTGEGSDTGMTRNKLEILEHLLCRLHARQDRLRNLLH